MSHLLHRGILLAYVLTIKLSFDSANLRHITYFSKSIHYQILSFDLQTSSDKLLLFHCMNRYALSAQATSAIRPPSKNTFMMTIDPQLLVKDVQHLPVYYP